MHFFARGKTLQGHISMVLPEEQKSLAGCMLAGFGEGICFLHIQKQGITHFNPLLLTSYKSLDGSVSITDDT
jgi:hypothetical protein